MRVWYNVPGTTVGKSGLPRTPRHATFAAFISKALTVDDETDELEVAEEADDTPYVEYDISVSPTDPTLELLSQQIARGDMIIPFYQRKYVWKIEQASKLIESFLMGLPVPQIFLFVNDQDQLEVIDGQQRVMSIHYFFEGYFGEADNRGRRTVFRLKGLAQRSEFNGKTFDELSDRDKRRLRNSSLRAINIKQLSPDNQNDSVFHIFERLNTGGTSLKPQEVRNAVYRGHIVDKLKELNADPDWQSILGLRAPDKNQKDVELVLRLFLLFEEWESYEKPMLRFLNSGMQSNREFDSDRAARFEGEFVRVTELVNNSLEKPFRPRRVINAAALEAVMVALMEDDEIDEDAITQNYDLLMADEAFLQTITGGTTDTNVLRTRIGRAKELLANGEG